MKNDYLLSFSILIFSTLALLAVHLRGKAKQELRIIANYNDPRLYGYEAKQAKKKVRKSTILFWISYLMLIATIAVKG